MTRISSPTEERNPRTVDIDAVPTLTLLQRINDEDATVAARVRDALPALATLVEAAVPRLLAGGCVHYFGAGSSGRLGVLDAAELAPTYGIEDGVVVAHLAGGDGAMRAAREGLEDDPASGAADAGDVVAGDVVIGLTASGRTPYVAGALRRGRDAGALTALVTSNPSSPLAALADIVVCADTGPEAITGSTRMKSATAQKLVLNAFSTAVMVRLGRTWSNLMTGLTPTNAKLRERLVRIVADATGASDDAAAGALGAAGGEVDVALVMGLAGVDASAARGALARAAADGGVGGVGGVGPAVTLLGRD